MGIWKFINQTWNRFVRDSNENNPRIKKLFPQAEIYDGVDEVIHQLQKILPKQTSDSKILQVKFVGSGKYRMKKVFFKYF